MGLDGGAKVPPPGEVMVKVVVVVGGGGRGGDCLLARGMCTMAGAHHV